MSTIYLVGCGKSKLDRPAPAQDLYTGALFRKSIALADRLAAPRDPVYILSALHGLTRRLEMVEPYDLALTDLPHADRLAWGCRVALDLALSVDGAAWLKRRRIVALAGAPYVGALQYGLAQLTGTVVRIEEPLKGLGIGQRLAWLNCALAA